MFKTAVKVTVGIVGGTAVGLLLPGAIDKIVDTAKDTKANISNWNERRKMRRLDYWVNE